MFADHRRCPPSCLLHGTWPEPYSVSSPDWMRCRISAIACHRVGALRDHGWPRLVSFPCATGAVVVVAARGQQGPRNERGGATAVIGRPGGIRGAAQRPNRVARHSMEHHNSPTVGHQSAGGIQRQCQRLGQTCSGAPVLATSAGGPLTQGEPTGISDDDAVGGQGLHGGVIPGKRLRSRSSCASTRASGCCGATAVVTQLRKSRVRPRGGQRVPHGGRVAVAVRMTELDVAGRAPKRRRSLTHNRWLG